MVIVLSTLIISINLFFVTESSVSNKPSASVDNIGSEKCKSCHLEIYNSYIHTAHYRDSGPADSNSIKGNFTKGKNVFTYNKFMTVEMVKDGGKYRQSAMINGEETFTADFDVVIGSGRKGQSYFYWSGNELFQLPVSYYTATNQWCNSPGFPDFFFFDRRITPNCMECHSTYTKAIPVTENVYEFDRSSIIYGIKCEKCHPGGEEHVSFQLSHPEDTSGKFIVNPAKLGRQLRMDNCGLCHSGLRKPLREAFSFKAGDTLDNFSLGNPVSAKADTLDVHGDQHGLLMASKCFLKSPQMDCNTCHNVHEEQINQISKFSRKCNSCHSESHQKTCTVKMENNIVMSENCIDCHMPVMASKKIMLNVNSGEKLLPDYIRTHYITVYRSASDEFLKKKRTQ